MAWLTGFYIEIFYGLYLILLAVGIIFFLKYYLLSPSDPNIHQEPFYIRFKQFTFLLGSIGLISGAGWFYCIAPHSLDDNYAEEFLPTYKRGSGLHDKWGMCIIPNKYNGIVKVFDNTTSSYHFVAFKVTDKEGEYPNKYYSFRLDIYNEDGKINNIQEVTESDCDNIIDHINKYIGKVYHSYEEGYETKIKYSSSYKHPYSNSSIKKDNEITNSNNTKNNQKEVAEPKVKQREPQKHERTVPMQVWKNCGHCFGSGQCSWCGGQGVIYYPNGGKSCPNCIGGKCSWCAGNGGHNEIQYETIVEYY
ncbi:MAG: hypothetical protein E7080_08210 [Bacteroidales bacterium]|nr:hypothetical protein [Bacteroidales bacterium]